VIVELAKAARERLFSLSHMSDRGGSAQASARMQQGDCFGQWSGVHCCSSANRATPANRAPGNEGSHTYCAFAFGMAINVHEIRCH